MLTKLPYILALAMGAISSASHAEPSLPQIGEVNDGGIVVNWSYSSVAGEENRGIGSLDVYVRDALTSKPIIYENGQLAGWLQRDRNALSDKEMNCQQRVKSFISQGVGRKADVDLNTYRIVTLNSDGSVAFINPFVGFNNAKLEAIVDLKGKPIDWLILPERMEAWVLLADAKKLITIDLQTRKLVKSVDLSSGPDAKRIIATPSGKIIISTPQSGKLGLLDPATSLLTQIEINGLVDALPVSGDEQHLVTAVAAIADGKVRLLRGDQLSRDLPFDDRPTSVAYSNLAKRFVLTGFAGQISFVDAQTSQPSIESKKRLTHEIATGRLFDNGRKLLAVGGGRASVMDVANGNETLSVDVPAKADQIVETTQFFYTVDRMSGRAALLAKDDLKHGRGQPVDVMLSSPEAAPSPVLSHGRFVASADGAGVLSASDTDGLIYQYSEGMMVPAGSYSNYRRGALGIAIVDYSLRSVEPGHYRGVVRLEESGRFDLVLAANAPRFSACASLTLNGQSVATAPLPHFTVELVGKPSRQGIHVRVLSRDEVGVTQPVSGLQDLTLLIFDKQSGWQRRAHFRETGNGEYQATFGVPQSARYALLAQSVSANLTYLEGSIGELMLGDQP